MKIIKKKKFQLKAIINLWFLTLTLKIRNYFFTGVIVLIPIGFTLYLSKFLINISSKLIPYALLTLIAILAFSILG